MGKTRDQGNLVSEGRPRLKSNRLSIGSDNTDYELAIKRTKEDGTGVQLHLWNNSVDNTGGNVWSGIRFTGSTNDYETSEIKSWRVHPGTGLNSLSFNTGGVERMVLSSSGVGIGTNSPDQTLHLYDSSAFASFTNSDDTGEAGILFRRHDNNQNRGYVVYDFTDDALKFRASNNGSGEDLRITDFGVGIGTTATSNSKLIVENYKTSNNESSVSIQTKTGSNAAGYSASGINIRSVANSSSGDNHTAYLAMNSRSPSLNGVHGSSAYITMSSPDSQGTYGTGQLDFYIRNGAAYGFPNDPSTPSNYWMSSLLTIKSSGLIGIGTNNPRSALDIVNTPDSNVRISFSDSTAQRNNFIGLDTQADELVISADEDNEGTDSHIKLRVDGIDSLNLTSYRAEIGNTSTWSANSYNTAAGSVAQASSGSNGHGWLATPWVYTSAIEATDERGTGSCGITLGEHGASNATTGAVDNIIMWTDGVDRLSINASGTVTIPGTLNVRTAIDLADNDELRFGSGDDAKIYHNGSHLYVDMNADDDIYIRDANSSNATRFLFDTSVGDLYIHHQIYVGRGSGSTYNSGVGNAITTYARDASYQASDTWTARTRIIADWRGAANETTNEDTAVIMSEVKDRGGNIWPIYKIDPSANTWSRGSSYIGRTRNNTTGTPTNYYTPSTNNSAGFYAYGGKNAITDRLYATAYWNRAFLRTYPSNEDLSNADDRAALEINWGTRVDNGGDPLAGPESNTQSLDIDQGQRAKISGAGRGEFIYGVWAGRVESDENSPNSVYINGESSVTAYAGNTSSVNNYNLRTGHNGYTQIIGRNTVDTDNVFVSYVNGSNRIRFQADGNGRFDGGADIGNADYAEMFEWSDGNPNNEDRRGYSVVLVGEKIRPATSSDDPADILGIISGNPGVLGDAAALNWNNRYLKDEFGTNITVDKEYLVWNKGHEYDESQSKIEVQLQYGEDEDQVETVMRHPKVPVAQPDPNDKNSLDGCERWPIDDIDNTTSIPQYARDNNIRAIYKELVPNPDYDPNLVYVPRRDRQEWDAVGMLGKLTLRKGQPTGAGWRKLSDINDTLERWLVR